MTNKMRRALENNSGSVDVIVMILILAISVGFVMIFKDNMVAYLNGLFAEIMRF